MLEHLTDDLSGHGVDLVLAHGIGGVRDIINRAEREPRIRIHASLAEAVATMTDAAG